MSTISEEHKACQNFVEENKSAIWFFSLTFIISTAIGAGIYWGLAIIIGG